LEYYAMLAKCGVHHYSESESNFVFWGAFFLLTTPSLHRHTNRQHRDGQGLR
jgi:hypothetical protein